MDEDMQHPFDVIEAIIRHGKSASYMGVIPV
jgi:hypothetical protein